MPNISLVTLAGIPGVSQAEMTQPHANDCGAYAVIGAVGAHGAFPRVAPLSYVNAGPQPVNNHSQTAVADTYSRLSGKAYSITGILNIPTGAVPVNPQLLTAGSAYNSPAAMAKVAMDLGRVAPNINAQAAGFAPLSALYPGEQARCAGVVGQGNVNVNAGNYAAPAANDTHIVCVHAGGGLHWVAQGSDGHFYDPANGSINNVWTPVHTNDPMGNYTFAGLWIVIH